MVSREQPPTAERAVDLSGNALPFDSFRLEGIDRRNPRTELLLPVRAARRGWRVYNAIYRAARPHHFPA